MPNSPTLATFTDSTGSLGADATYNGPARNIHVGTAPGVPSNVPPGRYASCVIVSATPTQACTINIQISADWGSANPSWMTIDSNAVNAGQNFSKEVQVPYRWVRIQVVNGATTQTASVTTAFQP